MRQLTNLEEELRSMGAVQYDLWLPETHRLPSVIKPDEQITGIVYGRYRQLSRYKQGHRVLVGRGALVATNRRVVLVDRKPLFMKADQITYPEIRTITYTKVFIAGTVTLHMEIGNISVRTFNQGCARHFVDAVEATIFQPSHTRGQ